MMKRGLTVVASLALVAACSSGSDDPQPPVGKAEDDATECRDGADNDDNGHTDCQDASCTNSTDQAILDYCASL